MEIFGYSNSIRSLFQGSCCGTQDNPVSARCRGHRRDHQPLGVSLPTGFRDPHSLLFGAPLCRAACDGGPLSVGVARRRPARSPRTRPMLLYFSKQRNDGSQSHTEKGKETTRVAARGRGEGRPSTPGRDSRRAVVAASSPPGGEGRASSRDAVPALTLEPRDPPTLRLEDGVVDALEVILRVHGAV